MCIRDRADVAVLREPDLVILELHFVAVPAGGGMAAHIENSRQLRPVGFRGPVEVARDVEPRPRLEMDFFNGEVPAGELPSDASFERASLGERPEAERVEVLLAEAGTDLLEILPAFHVGQKSGLKRSSFSSDVGLDRGVSRRLLR